MSFFRNRNPNEQSFVDHLEALRWHIVRILIAVLIGGVVCFIYIDEIFDLVILAPTHSTFPPYRWLCEAATKLNMPNLCLGDVEINFQNITLSGQFMMSMTASMLFGFIVAFPYIMWELWRFISPALTPKESKMSKGTIFWTSLLFFLGVSFGYFIITPYTVNFFANYKISPQFENIIRIDDYLDTLMNLVIGTGIVFELPVIVYFLSKIGLLTPRFMRTYRRYAWLVVLIVAAIITPPDVVSQIIVSIPIMLLYELSIKLSARIERRKIAEEKKLMQNYK